MNVYRRQVLFALSVAVGLAVVFGVSRGYYPILLINGSPVPASRFWKNYQALSFYQANYRSRWAENSAAVGSPPAVSMEDKELKALILDRLVDAAIVSAGARRELGKDLDFLLTEKIRAYDSNSELKSAAGFFYGMDFDDFRREVLVPQAEIDILVGRLYLRGEKFEEWLKKQREAARVIVFSPHFRWDGGKIVSD